jgi:hypothetical protein
MVLLARLPALVGLDGGNVGTPQSADVETVASTRSLCDFAWTLPRNFGGGAEAALRLPGRGANSFGGFVSLSINGWRPRRPRGAGVLGFVGWNVWKATPLSASPEASCVAGAPWLSMLSKKKSNEYAAMATRPRAGLGEGSIATEYSLSTWCSLPAHGNGKRKDTCFLLAPAAATSEE